MSDVENGGGRMIGVTTSRAAARPERLSETRVMQGVRDG